MYGIIVVLDKEFYYSYFEVKNVFKWFNLCLNV